MSAGSKPAIERRVSIDILSAGEVAKLLKVDRKTVYEAAARGKIPHRRLGRRVLFYRRALLDWLSCKGSSLEQGG